MIEIYTDGACSGNPGKGALAIILRYNSYEKELYYGYRLTTNNRMELLAVIIALESLKIKNIPIFIYSDSKYVVQAIQLQWLNKWIHNNFKGGIKNKDLWLRYYHLSRQFTSIQLLWVKGHADNIYNNRCDILAVNAIQSDNLHIDTYYELSQKK